MIFIPKLILTVFLCFSASISTLASPINLIGTQQLDLVKPHITYPEADVCWTKGTQQVVKWDISDIPQRTSETGVILLGHMEEGSDSENLDIDHPLASGFPINSGEQTIQVPDNIPSGQTYFVVLFGDSGNRSPMFQIV